MPVGYLPDMFGHVAQMPQLFRLAGFEHSVVWRGVPSAIDQIREVTDRLFGWIWPLPEDLHFYSGDRLMLGSVAHERDGWLMLTPTEFRDITNEVEDEAR